MNKKFLNNILLVEEQGNGDELPTSLWPVSGRPIVDNQLGQLPPQRITVTGDCSSIVKEFLPLAYPQHKFEFTSVPESDWDKYWVIRANQFAGREIDNLSDYRELVKKDEFYIFSKGEEKTYLFQDLVIKYFKDPARALKRFQKSQSRLSLFPSCRLTGEHLVSYKFVHGETLYNHMSLGVFEKFLSYCQEQVWEKVSLSKDNAKKFCVDFYKNKTEKRVDFFLQKKCLPEGDLEINGMNIPSVTELLKKVPWEKLYTDEFYFIHGDLQFDNIIYNPKTGFTLIDWREDFGGYQEGGDIYYDLSKLLAGMTLPFDKIKQGKFSLNIDGSKIEYKVDDHKELIALRQRYDDFIRGQFSPEKVQLLTSLIFLNMAPLHMDPLDKLFFSHGLFSLNSYLKL